MHVSCNDTQQTQNFYVKIICAIISLLFKKKSYIQVRLEILFSIPQTYAVLIVLL